MEKIQFDSGVKRYKLGDGVLKFNPGDPNVYARFLDCADTIRALEKDMVDKAAGGVDGVAAVRLMQEADGRIKGILNDVFGCGNDFDKLLGGVNLMAIAENGERVITNLFAALEPVLVQGAQACAQGKATEAVKRAKQRRGE